MFHYRREETNWWSTDRVSPGEAILKWRRKYRNQQYTSTKSGAWPLLVRCKWGKRNYQVYHLSDHVLLSAITIKQIIIGLRISFFLFQKLTVKLLNLICWEGWWSYFPSSLIFSIFLSLYISIDCFASNHYKIFSLVWVFSFQSGLIRTQVCLRMQRPAKQINKQTNKTNVTLVHNNSSSMIQLLQYFAGEYSCP